MVNSLSGKSRIPLSISTQFMAVLCMIKLILYIGTWPLRSLSKFYNEVDPQTIPCTIDSNIRDFYLHICCYIFQLHNHLEFGVELYYKQGGQTKTKCGDLELGESCNVPLDAVYSAPYELFFKPKQQWVWLFFPDLESHAPIRFLLRSISNSKLCRSWTKYDQHLRIFSMVMFFFFRV